MLNVIFPKNANNSTNIGKLNIITFGFITIITILRSIAHIILPDGGANTIATIILFPGNPDPDNVIYFIFALWGLSQLLMGILYIIVLFRYRNLIPLMWLFILAEYLVRIFIGRFIKPLREEYFTGTAPGEFGNYIFIPIALIMFIYSIYITLKDEKKKV